ncbi:MAG: S-methyl-5-thioribose-1-phosphate isomerase [Anaerolineaceae bacterium]
MRTIEWTSDANFVRLIDQRKLPNRLEYLIIHDANEMAQAIQSMAIRGAPALGIAGAFGLVLEALKLSVHKAIDLRADLQQAANLLHNSRPTAVNLGWGVKRIMRLVYDDSIKEDHLVETMRAEALLMAEEDVATNLRMAEFGASLIQDGDTILHHCNTGSLAAVDWGTALGAIRYAFEHGKKVQVLLDETRPRFQGARLSAWECQQYGIPFEVIADNAAGFFLHRGEVQKVMFGSDRVAANGDVVNKVGTYMLSLAARANDVPVYPVFPLTTLDLTISTGEGIPIEERPSEEVTAVSYEGEAIFPQGAKVRNPAFDVTPFELITAWVTERGIIRPPFSQNITHFIYNYDSSR